MKLIKMAPRASVDPIDTLDALHQIQHVKAAFALIEAAVDKPFHFLMPSYLDEQNRLYWCGIIEGEGEFELITTKFETRLAGAQASITLTRQRWGMQAHKTIMDGLKKIISENTPDSFNTAYWSFSDSMGLKKIAHPHKVLVDIVEAQR